MFRIIYFRQWPLNMPEMQWFLFRLDPFPEESAVIATLIMDFPVLKYYSRESNVKERYCVVVLLETLNQAWTSYTACGANVTH